ARPRRTAAPWRRRRPSRGHCRRTWPPRRPRRRRWRCCRPLRCPSCRSTRGPGRARRRVGRPRWRRQRSLPPPPRRFRRRPTRRRRTRATSRPAASVGGGPSRPSCAALSLPWGWLSALPWGRRRSTGGDQRRTTVRVRTLGGEGDGSRRSGRRWGRRGAGGRSMNGTVSCTTGRSCASKNGSRRGAGRVACGA
ncbi:hypothetical protein BU14_0327s0001, partial [Porphyra umbilicalis]